MQEEDLKTYVYRIIPEKELTACVCPDKMKVKGLTKRDRERERDVKGIALLAFLSPLCHKPLTIVQGKLWFSNRHKLYVMSGGRERNILKFPLTIVSSF